MIPLLRSLLAHQAWADSLILRAMAGHPVANEDEQLQTWALHIVLVQRYFFSVLAGRPFDLDSEMKVRGKIQEIVPRFREASSNLLELIDSLDKAALERRFEIIHLNWSPTAAEILTQVAMHSQHHRAQCASRLRVLGGSPPVVDYIVWIRERPAPSWS